MSQSFRWILNNPSNVVSTTLTGVEIPWTAPDNTDPRIHIGSSANGTMFWAQPPAEVRSFCAQNPSLVAVWSDVYGSITCAKFIELIEGERDDVVSVGRRFL